MKDGCFVTHRMCPVCLTRKGELLHQIKYPSEKDRVLPVEYRIIGCKSCGMVYDDFDADENVFIKHYENDGKYEMLESGGAGGVSLEDNKRWNKICDILEPHLKEKKVSILEVGCGKGGLLQCLWSKGFDNLLGIDASAGCIDYIKKNYQFEARCCSVENFVSDEKFDVVVAAQVLEHLYTCRSFIEKIKSVLKPNGLLYLEMPDASKYLEYNKSPFYFFDHEHINHFQPNSLNALLKNCGFRTILLDQFMTEPVKNFLYPNLATLATPESNAERGGTSANDYSVLIEYISDCQKRDGLIKNLPKIDGVGYLWGVGAFCQRLLESGAFSHLNICGLIDLDVKKQGTSIHGIEVFSPNVINNASDNSFVIITSVLYEQEIREMLLQLSYKGKIIVLK